ncbi:MAG: DUF1232 domain-containing protein [Muribaculaceae bacterium]|nr:DUF1232 domain-containing protein [Muribaculaceae bacterium]
MGKKLIDYLNYQQYFSVEGFWQKISNVAQKAGVKIVYGALLLFYASMDKNIPLADKAKIYGALGYFILPVDLIPDFLPGGYVDDLGALVWALKTVWDNITPEVHDKAYNKLSSWFSNIKREDLKLF